MLLGLIKGGLPPHEAYRQRSMMHAKARCYRQAKKDAELAAGVLLALRKVEKERKVDENLSKKPLVDNLRP